ncbi:AcrR family transcriptional regulator [Nakamurella sp. UYEF19]|uniref:TetR/AcrR family transcriptional regulator n=1 Tax=Nakamurella sp. UYEF19 TaxID=1756392 RepID=UPI0033979B08
MNPDRRGDADTARRPGGRSARAGAAILSATLTELVEVGYAALSLDLVAARAGVHRATIYRRWANKGDLVVAAVLASAAADIPEPDTGTLRGDLQMMLRDVVDTLALPSSRALLQIVVAEADRVPSIDAVARSFWQQRFELAVAVVERGKQRGELGEDVDSALFVEVLVAPLYLRTLVIRQPLTDQYADHLVDLALAPALASEDR